MSKREVKPEKTRARKPWGGRFQEGTDARVEAFTESVSFDYRLAPYDVLASVAHAEMLGAQEIITKKDARAIVSGLKSILRDVEANKFEFQAELEDVHMNVEAALTKRIGAAGGRLHTARSRNDQVATSLRLWLRHRIDETQEALLELRRALLAQAEAHVDTVMPGYTHLQRAQPVSLAHHLLAYSQMLRRDGERLAEVRARVNVLPLGAGALAGRRPPDRQKSGGEKARFRLGCREQHGCGERSGFCSGVRIRRLHFDDAPEQVGRGGLSLGERGVRLCRTGGFIRHGQFLDAPEKKPRRGRDRPRQEWARFWRFHRLAHHDERVAACL